MIKTLIFGICFLTTIQSFGQKSKLDLFCNQWIQFGYKSNNDSIVRFITADCSKKKCEFYKNGKYIEDIYCLKGYGNWTFNNDSTKFGFQFSEYMGQKIDNKLPIALTHLIIKLTPDTLIYGVEGYYGNSRIYGHDDLYFVRKK